MRRCLIALLAAVAAPACLAQAPGPAVSPECRRALEALRAEEDKAIAAQAGRPADASREQRVARPLEAARRRAATACLGGEDDVRAPAPTFDPRSVTVPRPAPAPPAAAPVVPAGPPSPAPRPVQPPAVVTNCDPGGCWSSDGTRLRRFGPNLVGPRGVCTVQGKIVRCP